MQFTTNLLVALLATSALAAPTKNNRNNGNKAHGQHGSFKVPSRARPKNLSDVDTHHEMSKAFAKFNFDLILPGLDNSPVTISIPDVTSIIGDILGGLKPTDKPQGWTKSAKWGKHTSTMTEASSIVPYYTTSVSYAAPVSTSSVETTTSEPPVYSSTEEPTSSTTEATSSYVSESTTEPASSYVPESTTGPATSSVSETSTTSAVESSSSAAPEPVSSSAAPESSIAPVTSAAPESTTPVSSAAPESTTAVPESTTSAAPESSTTPVTSEAASSTIAPSFSFAPTTSTTLVPSSTTSKVVATVGATPEQNESEYLSPVTIGGQSLTLDFDTGSADLWVFSSELSAAQIGGHAVFDPTKSSTWQPADGYTWKISYGDGSTAAGNVGFDAVTIGGATATRQAVEVATVVSSTFANDTNNDGLVGLGWSSINTIKPTAQKTFFENIMGDLDQPLFTADLRQDASGSYEFGTINTAKYTGDIHYTSIDNSKGFWEFPSTSYTINGVTYQNGNAAPAIADTGTSIILADSTAVAAYYAQVSGATVSSTAGGYIYPCTATLPDYGVAIGTSGFTAVVPGKEVTYATLGDGTCFGGIQSNAGINYQIFGDVLLKQYFAVFNGGAKTFGLAAKA